MAAKRIELLDKTIIYQYFNGIPIKKIADLHFASERTIYRRLHEMMVDKKNPFMRLVSKEKLSELYVNKNLSIESIARKYKVSYKIVKTALNKYMIPMKGYQRKVNKNEPTTRINCEKI